MASWIITLLLVVLPTLPAHANLILEIHPTELGVVAPDDLEIFASATVSSSVLANRLPGVLTVDLQAAHFFVHSGEELAIVLRATEGPENFWLGGQFNPYAGGTALGRVTGGPWLSAGAGLFDIDFGFAVCIRPEGADVCVEDPTSLPNLEDVSVFAPVRPGVDFAQIFTVTRDGFLDTASVLLAPPEIVPGPPTWALMGIPLAGWGLRRALRR